MSMATVNDLGIQMGTERTVYATWEWSNDNTDKYQVRWYYSTADGKFFFGSESTVELRECTYNAPENAVGVKFHVKPISKTYQKNNTTVNYWTADWSTAKTYNFENNPPSKPNVPTVLLEKFMLTASLDNLDVNATSIQFQVVKDNESIFKSADSTIKADFNYVRYTCYVDAGSEYKVRCRARREDLYSEWTDYSNPVKTIPSAPLGITTIKANSDTSVYLEWSESATATSYDIEYATKKEYFDGSNATTTETGIESTHYEKTGLETGDEYFFRVRAVNDEGVSAWSGIVSVVIGKAPAAPTTWSSSTRVITGEPLNLYWTHNSEDGSNQTYAELEIYVNGVKETYTVRDDPDDDRDENTYQFDTTDYVEGVKIQWRCRTAGVTNVYGDWSVQRTVDIYNPPTLQLEMTDIDENPIETLTAFPFYIYGLAGPRTQMPIGYHLVIRSNEIYETVDSVGNTKIVNAGEDIYSKHFDINDPLLVEFSPNNIDLENNISYTVLCMVTMNSGLTAESSVNFTVGWTEQMYEPNAEIGVDTETFTAIIRPYCVDANGDHISDVTLSVYRREFDGSFIELISDLTNDGETFITDPHPSLDFARYRVVAVSTETGAVSYYDVPGYPVQGKAVIIQWDEAWSTFDVSGDDILAQPVWAGSLLCLPYNIDVSDDTETDVALVEYIGRNHPVSYYGTQRGFRSTWNVEIPKNDKETLYTLRRLSNWMGDVYVREPSGTGYWANVTVSYSQKHCEVTIPVTLSIIRVEGGI